MSLKRAIQIGAPIIYSTGILFYGVIWVDRFLLGFNVPLVFGVSKENEWNDNKSFLVKQSRLQFAAVSVRWKNDDNITT